MTFTLKNIHVKEDIHSLQSQNAGTLKLGEYAAPASGG